MRAIVRLPLMAALLLSALPLTNAEAAFLTWRMTGTITEVSNPELTLAVPASVGDLFTLDYTFDDGIASDFLADPTVGQYFGVLTTMTFSIGPNTITRPVNAHPDPNSIVAYNDAAEVPGYAPMAGQRYDQYVVYGGYRASPLVLDGQKIYWSTTVTYRGSQPSVAPFASDVLPTVPPSLAVDSLATALSWEQLDRMPGDYWSYSYMRGSIDSIRDTAPVSAVPEPGTLALLTLGLVGLGLARRKRAARR